VSSRPTATSPEPQGVETSLQLQTPGGPSPSPTVAHSPSHRKTNTGGARPQVWLYTPYCSFLVHCVICVSYYYHS
jgi:hypothetical protein